MEKTIMYAFRDEIIATLYRLKDCFKIVWYSKTLKGETWWKYFEADENAAETEFINMCERNHFSAPEHA